MLSHAHACEPQLKMNRQPNIGIAMSDRERLELWREERDRLLGLIAGDPTDSDGLNDVLRDDVVQIERFIRHYETKVAEECPGPVHG
jgi:hypothetical protein